MCCFNFGCGFRCCQYRQDNSAKRGLLVVFLVTLAIIAGLSISGLVYAPRINNDYDQLKCASFLFINEALYGSDSHFNQNSSWVGAIDALISADDVISYVKNTQSRLLNLLSRPLGEGNFATTQKPEKESFGGILSFFDPAEWYRKYVGGLIDSLKSKVENALSKALVEETSNALDELKEFVDASEQFRQNLYNYTETGDSAIKGLKWGVLVYFGMSLALAGAIITGLVMHGLRKWEGIRVLLRTAWIGLSIMAIIGLGYTTAMFPLAVVGVESCNALSIQNVEKNSGFMTPELWEKAKVCLTGDGDIGRAYEITGKLAEIQSVSDTLDSAAQAYAEIRGKLSRLLTDKGADYTTNLQHPPAFTLETLLNIFSSANCKRDKAVWDEADCGNMLTLNTPLDPDNRCIVVKNLSSINLPFIIGNRYSPKVKMSLAALVDYIETVHPVPSANRPAPLFQVPFRSNTNRQHRHKAQDKVLWNGCQKQRPQDQIAPYCAQIMIEFTCHTANTWYRFYQRSYLSRSLFAQSKLLRVF
eukprot:TRINITY_DN135228_c0_g1_i1.p1 TRINITY_DN135228_c0_g1~~TRINITY_DN135228_c0_g1_i1.p1  ORF type:complete len:531 (-),score=25.33 TRINITY_DN135228_c0_g1_i1:166-1758(-)